MKLSIPSFLSKTFLFSALDLTEVEKICNDIQPRICEFDKGEAVFDRDNYERKLAFVASGEVEVFREREDGTPILLNTHGTGASFGILTLFSDSDDYPTLIIAKKQSSVIFLTKKQVLDIMKRYPAVSVEIIKFLTKKVEFLGGKVETFSGGSVEEKLKSYIASESKVLGNPFPFNFKKTAERLGVGRASLYRAIDHLEKIGCIKLSERKIYILKQETKGTQL